jgi:hypothetical protein
VVRGATVPDGAHGPGNIDPREQDRIYPDAAAFLFPHL